MRKLKVGIIGSGFIAQFQARAMVSCRNMELSGILNRSGSADFANWTRREGLGPVDIYESIAELCKNVDCVAMYVPNDMQVSVVQEIASAKLAGAAVYSIIIDKPLGRNLQEAAQIVRLIKEANLLSAYFENQIFMKAVSAQKHQLAAVEAKMGAPLIVRSAEEHAGPHKPWFWDPRRSGGGVLLDMGCHSIAAAWYMLTPLGKSMNTLKPISVSCTNSLLKWGQPKYAEMLQQKMGVDYRKYPAEDFTTGVIHFQDQDTKRVSIAQFTDSWMFDKQGLRLYMEGLGAGYGFEINTLQSPLQIFIGDEAASDIANSETALEKSTSNRGLMTVQTNESDLYGYIDENLDAAKSFLSGQDAKLPVSFGYEITRLVMACYMSAEQKRTIDLTDGRISKELESFVPLVQQGRGSEQLL